MCGIIHIKGSDKINTVKKLIKTYKRQRSRGTEGFGFVAVRNNKVIGYERSAYEDGILNRLKKYKLATEFMFHHRLPTSVDNYAETAHPILVSNEMLDYDYYLVHNGHVSNSNTLKEKHERLGFVYNTEIEKTETVRVKKNGKKIYSMSNSEDFNDSESLAIEVALYLDGKSQYISARGSVAFMCYKVDKNTKEIVSLHYLRNTNPIFAERTGDYFILSSVGNSNAVSIGSNTMITIEYKPYKIYDRALYIDGGYKSLSNSNNHTHSHYVHESRCIHCNEVVDRLSPGVLFTLGVGYRHITCHEKYSEPIDITEEIEDAQKKLDLVPESEVNNNMSLKYDDLCDEQDELNERIEQLLEITGIMESSGTSECAEEYFKKCNELDDAQSRLAVVETEIQYVMEYLLEHNIPF